MFRAFDTAALREPIDRTAIRRQSEAEKGTPSRAIRVIRALLVVATVWIFVTAYVGVIHEIVTAGPKPGFAMLGLLTALLAFVLFAFFGNRGFDRARLVRRWRLTRFAEANGLGYLPESGAPEYPGMIFRAGSSRHVRDRIFAHSGSYFDTGTLRAVSGSGKNQNASEWSYLALRLPRRLPNIVLDATANDTVGISSLPEAVASGQRLSLEGDFDRHFTLYCPAGYERDALYIFTPDLMALLIDETAPFDVEIADDWMIVFTRRHVDPLQPASWERFQRIIELVLPKARSRTVRYRDERAPTTDAVARQGKRLRAGVPWVSITIGVVVAVGWIVLRFSVGG